MTSSDEPNTADTVDALRSKVAEYERWFRFLDSQNRVLERERQKLSAVLNHTDAGFLVMDPTLRVISANNIFANRFCSSRDEREVIAAACHEVLCGREAPCESCPVAKVFASSEVAHCELPLEGEGEPRLLYATAMPIHSEYGDIEEALVMLQDVSGLGVLRTLRKALETSEERLRLFLETAKTS